PRDGVALPMPKLLRSMLFVCVSWSLFVTGQAAQPVAMEKSAAQSYPTRPMRMVIPNPPGGTLDIAARLVAPKMTELSGQSVIVDHRPGADTNIGTEIVARAPADGYTMVLQSLPFVVNPALT